MENSEKLENSKKKSWGENLLNIRRTLISDFDAFKHFNEKTQILGK